MKRFSFLDYVLGPLMLMVVVAVISFAVAGNYSTAEADEYAMLSPGPYDSQNDTFAIQSGDTLSRAIGIKGAVRFALHVPTIDETDLKVLACFDADSTFSDVHFRANAGDSLTAFTLHNGTGAFSIDLTQWVTGFEQLKFETGDTMTVIRTFHYTIKY